MAFIEIEQKYRLKDPAKVRARLKSMGARKLLSGSESNEFYDKQDFFRKQKVALRLRRFGKGPATLTLKGPRIKNKFTKRMEIETPIEYAAAKAIFRFLGCQVVRQYTKKRELYRLGKTVVVVDFLKKFGWFLEIEGRPQSIKKIESKLGLCVRDREERSYLQMMFGWKH